MGTAAPVVQEREVSVSPAERETGLEWQRRYGRILVLSDLVVLAWVFVTVHLVWAAYPRQWDGLGGPRTPWWILISVVTLVLWHLVLTLAGTRDARVLSGGADEYKRVINSTLVIFSFLAFFCFVVKFSPPRAYVIVGLPFGLVMLVLSRWSWRQWLLVQRQAGRMTHRAIVVGNRESVEHLAAVIGRNEAYGYHLVGVCLTGPDEGKGVAGLPAVGSVDALKTAALSTGADAVIVTSSDATHPDMVRRLGWDLEGHSVEIIVAPSLANIAGPRVHIRPVAGLPLLHVEKPAYRGGARWAKGTLDRFGAWALLLVSLPIFLVVAIAIKLNSKGPVFFVQERVGRDGKTFGMIKFRTMVDGADQMLDDLTPDSGNAVMFKMREDPRVTSVGKHLRRFSIDELPQLINVIKGDMSLVGPRPPLVSEVSVYAADARRRLLVRPGITGPWQISGRSDLNWEETMRLDLYYVENWSIVGDLLILWKTLRAVIRSTGAY
ncbi:sugar transferase [Aeromicrobium panaciterrae]|uniref:sugar transferase n=1 Tax=Aeromicrobium panaciterrae TaxID=363861 RepID=UPI0031D78E32